MAGFGDITKMLGQFKGIQANMQRMQEELSKKTLEASSGGGVVTAKVNGKGELLKISFDRDMVDTNDLELLEDLVKAAVNAAVSKSREQMQQELSQVTGGLNLPGMDQLSSLLG